MKTLIAYYSLGGNTRKIAQRLQQETGGDLLEIKTVHPYTGSYNAIVEQGHREVNSGYLPEIQPVTADLSSYDRILLGSPVWWYTFAPAMHTFLQGRDWAGREIYPFATNGGWLGHTFPDFAQACAGAHVHPGLNVQFDGRSQQTPDSEIARWIEENLK